MSTFRDDEQRQKFKERLADVIDETMRRDEDMRRAAIIEGRIGLDEMNDADLIELARDCWGVEV